MSSIKIECYLLDGTQRTFLSWADVFAVGDNITDITLNDENVESLPDEIGSLRNLKFLDLNDCSLRFLPDSFCELTNLEKLYLDGNMLTSLPANFGNLSKLKHLYLSHNELTVLPDSMENLHDLQHFFCNTNKLTTLPYMLLHRGNLLNLDVTYNPIDCSREQMISIQENTGINIVGSNYLRNLNQTD